MHVKGARYQSCARLEARANLSAIDQLWNIDDESGWNFPYDYENNVNKFVPLSVPRSYQKYFKLEWIILK